MGGGVRQGPSPVGGGGFPIVIFIITQFLNRGKDLPRPAQVLQEKFSSLHCTPAAANHHQLAEIRDGTVNFFMRSFTSVVVVDTQHFFKLANHKYRYMTVCPRISYDGL